MTSDSPTGGQATWPDNSAPKGDTNIDPRNRPMRVQLSPEEIQVLKEFRTQSFWYYCVPWAGFNCVGLHLLARRGLVKYHPRFGYLFGYIAAIGLGYIGGKLLAFPAYKEKLLNLQDGYLADEIRQGRSGFDVVKRWGEPTKDQSDPEYKPDDNFRPYVDYQDVNKDVPSYSNYEDMRKRNRQEYERSQHASSAPSNQSSHPPYRPPQTFNPQPSQPGPKRNQYGDIIDE